MLPAAPATSAPVAPNRSERPSRPSESVHDSTASGVAAQSAMPSSRTLPSSLVLESTVHLKEAGAGASDEPQTTPSAPSRSSRRPGGASALGLPEKFPAPSISPTSVVMAGRARSTVTVVQPLESSRAVPLGPGAGGGTPAHAAAHVKAPWLPSLHVTLLRITPPAHSQYPEGQSPREHGMVASHPWSPLGSRGPSGSQFPV